MALSESERDELHESVRKALGARGAELFMTTVPGPDDEPASRRDVSDAAQVLRGEVENLRAEFGEVRAEVGEVRAEVGEVRAEVGEVRAEVGEVRAEVGEVRVLMGEMRTDITSLTNEVRHMGVRFDAEFVAVRGEMAAQGGRLLSQMWLSSFSAAATAGALVLAAVALA